MIRLSKGLQGLLSDQDGICYVKTLWAVSVLFLLPFSTQRF